MNLTCVSPKLMTIKINYIIITKIGRQGPPPLLVWMESPVLEGGRKGEGDDGSQEQILCVGFDMSMWHPVKIDKLWLFMSEQSLDCTVRVIHPYPPFPSLNPFCGGIFQPGIGPPSKHRCRDGPMDTPPSPTPLPFSSFSP